MLGKREIWRTGRKGRTMGDARRQRDQNRQWYNGRGGITDNPQKNNMGGRPGGGRVGWGELVEERGRRGGWSGWEGELGGEGGSGIA